MKEISISDFLTDVSGQMEGALQHSTTLIYNTDRDARFLEDAIVSVDRVLQNIIDIPQNYQNAIKRIITYCDMISFELDSLSDLLMQIQKYEERLPEEAQNIGSSLTDPISPSLREQ